MAQRTYLFTITIFLRLQGYFGSKTRFLVIKDILPPHSIKKRENWEKKFLVIFSASGAHGGHPFWPPYLGTEMEIQKSPR